MPDGTDYDRCPRDGCLEVERWFRCGGSDGRAEHQHWALFHADPRRGGCGASWSRTTRTGAARARARGRPARDLTASAACARTYSLPSAAYRAAYDRIDWSR